MLVEKMHLKEFPDDSNSKPRRVASISVTFVLIINLSLQKNALKRVYSALTTTPCLETEEDSDLDKDLNQY